MGVSLQMIEYSEIAQITHATTYCADSTSAKRERGIEDEECNLVGTEVGRRPARVKAGRIVGRREAVGRRERAAALVAELNILVGLVIVGLVVQMAETDGDRGRLLPSEMEFRARSSREEIPNQTQLCLIS